MRRLISRSTPCKPLIRLPQFDVDQPNGLVDDGLLLLLGQQRDQLLLGADVAPDAPVGVVEEADDGGLFASRCHRHGKTGKFVP